MRIWVWLAAVVTVHAAVCRADTADVRLNEVYSDAPGTDTIEYIELHGLPGDSLAGLSVLTIEGDTESDVGVILDVMQSEDGWRLLVDSGFGAQSWLAVDFPDKAAFARARVERRAIHRRQSGGAGASRRPQRKAAAIPRRS